MNKKLFFLSRDGWFEEEVTGKLLQASQEELVLWAYAMMERKNYRNYLITENPKVAGRHSGTFGTLGTEGKNLRF